MGGLTSKQVRHWPCPSGTKYARFARALRMSLLENVPTREAVCRRPVHERSSHAGVPGGCIVRTVAMPEVSETDFAIVVFREDDGWDADVLPVAVTGVLKGFIRVLRQQPSIAGTIGLAGIDDYFFVAIRVVGNQISVLLSDIGAALDY